MKSVAAIAGGIVYALLCLVLAFGMAGGGHGWISPLWISLFGLALIPLSFWCGVRWRHTEARNYAMIAISGLVLADIALVMLTVNEGLRYYENSGNFGNLWIFLWVFPHMLPITGLFLRFQSMGELDE